MLGPKTVADVESLLGYLLSLLTSAKRGNRKGFDEGAFNYARLVLAAAERPLTRLGMYLATEAALNESEQLVAAGELDKADVLLLKLVREMMEKSGSNDRLRKLYTPKTSERKQ